MKRILLIVILLYRFLPGFSDNLPTDRKKPDTMLFGDVITENEEHIPFATVLVKGTTIGTAADLSGHFKLTGVPAGEQVVVISAVGYSPAEYPVQLAVGKPVTIRAFLKPDQIGLEQVVVSADRGEKSRREAATIVSTINPHLVERTQSVTLGESLNFTPGVRLENNCQNCGFTQVRMNGLEGPYSQILINSRPVFSGLAGVYGLELIPATMIDRVEVVRGGGSALFGGNAIAGTINLITKEPVRNSFAADGATSFIGDDGTLDYSMNFNGSILSDDYRTGMSLYAFKRDRDPYDDNGDGFSEISKLQNSTFGTSFFQRLGARSKINVDYFYINESRRGGNAFEKLKHEADICEAVDHRINSASATFDKLMKDHDKFSVYGAFQSVDRDSYYGAGQDPLAYGHTEDFSYSLGTQLHKDLEKCLFTHSDLVVGLEVSSDALKDTKLGGYDEEAAEHIENTLIADQKVTTYGAFAQNEWIWEAVRLGVGLRAEHYNITDKASNANDISGDVLAPRANLLVNVTSQLQLRTSFARGYRAPQIFDEDLHIESSTARRVTHENDPDLEQETSNSYTFSVDYTEQLGKFVCQFLAEAFYTDLQNPFVNEYGEPDADGNVVYTRYNAEDGAVVKGVNMELNASVGSRFVFQSGLTLQSSKYDVAQSFDERRFFRTPDTYGYLTMTYSPTARFKLSATGNYTGKMLIEYFGPEQENPDAGELRETGTFFDLGLKVSQDFKLADDLNLRVYGGVKNVFNSYQDDFDTGAERDPAYIYGPLSPRTFYIGVKLGNLF